MLFWHSAAVSECWLMVMKPSFYHFISSSHFHGGVIHHLPLLTYISNSYLCQSISLVLAGVLNTTALLYACPWLMYTQPIFPRSELVECLLHPLPYNTVRSLSKAPLSQAQEAQWSILEGAGPCAMEWPKPGVVTSIPFVPSIWIEPFDERPNSTGNYNLGRLKGKAKGMERERERERQGGRETLHRQTKCQSRYCRWRKHDML